MKKWNYLVSTILSLPIAVFAQSANVGDQVSQASVSFTYSRDLKSSVAEDQSSDPSKSKSFSKSFSLSGNDKVEVNNRYGSITVKIWSKAEVKLDAQIEAFARSEKEVENLLDRTQIQAIKTGDLVSYKTILDLKGINSFGSGTRNGIRWRREIKIHMTLYVPASQAINLTQAYGPINMGDHDGPTALKVQYGNLNAGNLNHLNNYISVQYGKVKTGALNEAKLTLAYGEDSYVKEAKNIQVSSQYSSLTIPKVHKSGQFRMQYGKGLVISEIDNLDFQGQYTSLTVNTVRDNALIKMQYGSGVKLDYAKNVNYSAQYTSLNLNTLAGSFKGAAQYGKLNIERVEAGPKQITVDGAYTPINIGFDPNYNAALRVSTYYGGVNFGDRFKAQLVSPDKSAAIKQYLGGIGTGTGNEINIESKYGNVVLK